MKKYAVPVVCLLLAISVSYFIYSNVISNLYKRQYIDSLISEIFIKVSDTRESLLELIERGEGTMDDMKYVCANFDSLSILAGSGYGINNSAESYFYYIGATFIGNGSTTPVSYTHLDVYKRQVLGYFCGVTLVQLNYRQKSNGMYILSKQDIDDISAAVLTEYSPKNLLNAIPLDTMDLLENYLGLTVKRKYIGTVDSEILGLTVMDDYAEIPS